MKIEIGDLLIAHSAKLFFGLYLGVDSDIMPYHIVDWVGGRITLEMAEDIECFRKNFLNYEKSLGR